MSCLCSQDQARRNGLLLSHQNSDKWGWSRENPQSQSNLPAQDSVPRLTCCHQEQACDRPKSQCGIHGPATAKQTIFSFPRPTSGKFDRKRCVTGLPNSPHPTGPNLLNLTTCSQSATCKQPLCLIPNFYSSQLKNLYMSFINYTSEWWDKRFRGGLV